MSATRRTLLAGGAVAFLPGVGSLGRPAPARAEQAGDVEMLEKLLALENQLFSAYEAALRRGVVDPGLGEALRDQEREHRRALEGVLAELGRRSPRATVPPDGLASGLRSGRAFIEFASGFEGEAAAAYAEAAAAIRDPELRGPLGSIMVSEAAHQVALRAAGGLPLS